jgi:hypothetical protein
MHWFEHELTQLVRMQTHSAIAIGRASAQLRVEINDWSMNRQLGIFEPFDHSGRVAAAAKLQLVQGGSGPDSPTPQLEVLRQYSNWRMSPQQRFGCLDFRLTPQIDLASLGPELAIWPLISEGTIQRGAQLLVPIQCGAVFRAGKLLGHCRDLTLVLDRKTLLGDTLQGQLRQRFFRLKSYKPVVFAAKVV